MKRDNIRITIVIVTYNSVKLLKECINSIISNNDIGDKLEIIVVDNKSKDIVHLKELVSSYKQKICLIENDKNGGYGQGNNVGIRNSNGDIIMIMNPDVRCIEPIFQNAINQMDCSNCVLLGMQQWDVDLSKSESYRLDSPYSCFLKDIIEIKLSNRIGYFNPNRMYISGSCFFIKKEKFEEIGLFDENIFMYYEESDIKRRIMNKFGKNSIVFNRKLNYIHAHPKEKFNSKSNILACNSMKYFANKYNINLGKFKRKILNNLYFFRLLAILRRDNISIIEYNKSISYLKHL